MVCFAKKNIKTTRLFTFVVHDDINRTVCVFADVKNFDVKVAMTTDRDNFVVVIMEIFSHHIRFFFLLSSLLVILLGVVSLVGHIFE